MSIRNEEGIRFVNEDVANEIVKHFEDFLGKRRDVQSLGNRHNIFINKINTEEAQRMIRVVSDAEIKNAMFDIEDSKAPGPDSYTALLGSLVGENQSAFIEGRKITDNILLSQELFKGYNRKQKTKKVSFKINLQKAYDTISWDFLKEILEMFGFHKTMVNWIMTCITSTKFSINVNGERVGYFKGDRGLRQGDPYILLIFSTLVMEVLNLLIQKNIEESKGFKYHFGCKNLKITHLCFADDLLVFCHGDVVSVKVMKKSLDEFSGFSGLLPNMQKSTIFFGGLSNAEQQCIINIIPFTVGTLLNYWASVFLLPKQNYIDSRDIYDARLNNNCTINGIINEGRWNWHEEWKSDFVELNQIQVPNLLKKNIAYYAKKLNLANRQNIFINKINTDEAQRMIRVVSDVEIKNAMFEIEDSKAPCPDCYTACFYKSAWSIVGKEVCQAIKDFFSNGKLLGEVNATLISLVPKIPTLARVSDFRPIACCNVLYKCISKILTSRIKGVLGSLVGENQSAFIEGRQITDNILISQELFKGYNRKQKTKKVSFKIDLQKAYDTISWDFLKEILEMFGFHKTMVNWIMTCINSTKFSINMNGERVGYFTAPNWKLNWKLIYTLFNP
ncbi:RNA-directed DNA polymerase, eukaryota, reverse transcriptase zinc-binding domain protein [Tanacetum coccineum]